MSFFEEAAKELYDTLMDKEPVRFNDKFYRQTLQNEIEGIV